MKKASIFFFTFAIFLFVSSQTAWAVFLTESNVVCTKVGNSTQACTTQSGSGGIVPVGEGGAKIASTAKQIAGQLLHSTKQRNELNQRGIRCDIGDPYVGYHCWTNDKMAKYNYPGDSLSYLQCTEFIWAAFAEADPSYEPLIRLITGNANQWVRSVSNNPEALKHFTVFNNANELLPGDIISLGHEGANAWGHVAIVVEKQVNFVVIAQAATSEEALEKWMIDESGRLIPAFSDRTSRNNVNGFIRLKAK